MARETFGQTVRRLRTEAGMTQEELASIAGLERSALGLLERGMRDPAFFTAVDIAWALGVSLDAFREARPAKPQGNRRHERQAAR